MLDRLATQAVGGLFSMRAKRASATAGELPAIQRNTERFFAGVILFGFVLVDLGQLRAFLRQH